MICSSSSSVSSTWTNSLRLPIMASPLSTLANARLCLKWAPHCGENCLFGHFFFKGINNNKKIKVETCCVSTALMVFFQSRVFWGSGKSCWIPVCVKDWMLGKWSIDNFFFVNISLNANAVQLLGLDHDCEMSEAAGGKATKFLHHRSKPTCVI